MKIAVTAKGKEIESEVDSVFGRCSYFIFADVDGDNIENVEAVKNEFSDQTGGVGISTAKLVAEKGAKVIIANNVGPRAVSVLEQFKIKIYSGKGSVKDTIKSFSSGKLEEFK
jgi:predicted Fe-Mo cluster-binding NifX family protein